MTAEARYRALACTCLLEAERTDNPKFEKSLIATAKLYLRTGAAMRAAEAATAASNKATLITETRMVAEPQAAPAATYSGAVKHYAGADQAGMTLTCAEFPATERGYNPPYAKEEQMADAARRRPGRKWF